MKKYFLLLTIPLAAIFLFLNHSLSYADSVTCKCPCSSYYCGTGSSFCDCAKYGTAQQIHCTQRICTDGTKYLCTTGGSCTSLGTACSCSISIDATYPNGGTCVCCTQISCTCTPSCPSGTSTTVSGSLCEAGKASCSQSNSCSSCTSTGSMCYYPETNTSFIQSNGSTSGPASISIIVDGVTYQLSTDSNNPTKIKLPAVNSTNVKVSVPTFTPPTTSTGGGYYFQADNYGTNNQWKGWVSCSGTAGEDFCIDGGTTATSNTITFTPTTQTVGNVLTEGAKGKISGMYYTVNKCDTSKKYSTAIEGYYVVDTPPIVPPQGPVITKVATLDGCNSTTYTGLEANNPLNMTTTLTYSNPDDIQGLILWFSKDTSVPTSTQISDLPNSSYTEVIPDTYCPINTTLPSSVCSASPYVLGCPSGYNMSHISNGTIACMKTTGGGGFTSSCPNNYNEQMATAQYLLCCPNNTTYNSTSSKCEANPTRVSSIPADLGILLKKNGTTWDNPLIYEYGINGMWNVLGSDSTLRVNSTGQVLDAVKINLANTSKDTSTLTLNLTLQFLETASSKVQGLYNLYALGLDKYMINGTSIDQSRIKNYFQWGIDLINPTTTDPSQTVKDQSNFYFNWSSTDPLSGINKVLINAYKTGGTASDQLELTTPTSLSKGKINLIAQPADDQIGLYNDTNAWTFTNSTGEQDTINIGNNEGGKISLYVTAYDNACNSSAKTTDVDLNPWFTTYGGLVYSKGNINTQAKKVSSINWTFKNTALTKDTLDLGTELLATRNQAITTLVHSNLGGVRAFLVYDSNNTKNRYDTLKSKFNSQSGLTPLTAIQNKTSDTCMEQNCYLYSADDIVIPSGYVCDKNTLFISDGNITINPDITSDSSKLSGCIFLAKNNIYIGAGTYKSTSTIGYDYIEGEFIADNQIIFTIADQLQPSGIRDGIEVSGSLIAFGSNISSGSAVSIQRNLRLFNQSNPALVQSYNPKFGAISQIYFGTDVPVYSQEVGFKSF